MKFGKLSLSVLVAGLFLTGATAQTCPANPFPPVTTGPYGPANNHCVQGGNGTPFGFEFAYKITGCPDSGGPLTPVVYTLDTGNLNGNPGTCPIASSIQVTVRCNGASKDATISWTGAGTSNLAIKVKGSTGGYIDLSPTNGGTFSSQNGHGISHIEICIQCPNCPQPTPTPPTGGPPTARPPTNGMGGDPHVKSWNGEHFDYMGECDLKLMHAPKFDGEQDLTVHARTTIQHDYSYMETAAVRIGTDTLEVSSWGEYALNGVEGALFEQPVLRKGNALNTLGGYPVFHTQMSKIHHLFDVVLGPKENVTLSNIKNIVSVKVNHNTNDHFVDVEGLLGHINGKLLARDGVTDLHDDINAFGQEWQVRDDEPMLFRSVREPQYPNRCRLPDIQEKESRRLSEGITEEVATAACAHLRADAQAFADCVYDVTATNDLDMADVGAY
ncbi:unknown protein [Seminavis robusta]|uniref:VWFD domain-containing protein n=1 Tax=Seminavis robusta TaxID=568900 RepID=A0A9N8E2L1_9STRA|nr:unknown protein [Seminavis robusta]|eukprot:Sro442_g143790.1 n/a (443) ;mRNA; f:3050-4443